MNTSTITTHAEPSSPAHTNPISVASAPVKPKKGKQSASSILEEAINALLKAGCKQDIEDGRFAFAQPDLHDPNAGRYLTVTSTLTGNRTQDLLEIALVEAEQAHVLLASGQLTCPSMKIRANGDILNLLNQQVQRALPSLKHERVFAVYKGKVYSPAPFDGVDRSLLEPRTLWKEAKDEVGALIGRMLTQPEIVAAERAKGATEKVATSVVEPEQPEPAGEAATVAAK